MSPPAVEKYKVVRLKNNEIGHTMSLKEAISICNKIESVKGYELSSEILLQQKVSQSDLYVAQYDLNVNQTDLQKFGSRSAKQRDYDKYGPRQYQDRPSRERSLERRKPLYKGPTKFSKDYGRTAGKDHFSRGSSREEGNSSRERRSQSNGRSDSYSRNRYSPGGSSQNQKGRDGQRGEYRQEFCQSRSPSQSSHKWAERFRSPVSKGLCVRCGSRGHRGKECKRYPWEVPTTCNFCKFLFHQTDLCRFKPSRYVTPTRTPPYASPVSYKKQINCTETKAEEGKENISSPTNLWAKNC